MRPRPLTACALLIAPLAALGACAETTPMQSRSLWSIGDAAGGGPADPDNSGASGMVFNEVMADNASTIMDADLDFPDWIELYNAGAHPVDLERVTLTDASGETWRGPGRVLAPGDHHLIWADDQGVDGSAPFQIDRDGDQLTLRVGGEAVDHLATGALDEDMAWARFPDGGAWALTAQPTPGYTNGTHPGSLDPSEELFSRELLEFDITIPQSSMDALAIDPYTDVPASVGVLGAWFPEVGVRIKGVIGSLRTLDQKAGLKIDVNEYQDYGLRGLDSLSFNNMVQDPSYVHEYLTYRLWRAADLPAPRTNWVKLTLNGEYYGLFLLVESIDDEFLERWWGDDSGTMYEGAYGVDFVAGTEFDFEHDEGDHPDDRSDITAVIEALAAPADDAGVAALEQLINMDQLLRYMALEGVTAHWDGYSTANNYRIYNVPATGRFEWIPWGTDQTWGWNAYSPYSPYGLAFNYCLANAACAARYDAALVEMTDLVDSLPLEAEMDAALERLYPEIALDPRRESSDDSLWDTVETTRWYLNEWQDEIRAMAGG